MLGHCRPPRFALRLPSASRPDSRATCASGPDRARARHSAPLRARSVPLTPIRTSTTAARSATVDTSCRRGRISRSRNCGRSPSRTHVRLGRVNGRAGRSEVLRADGAADPDHRLESCRRGGMSRRALILPCEGRGDRFRGRRHVRWAFVVLLSGARTPSRVPAGGPSQVTSNRSGWVRSLQWRAQPESIHSSWHPGAMRAAECPPTGGRAQDRRPHSVRA